MFDFYLRWTERRRAGFVFLFALLFWAPSLLNEFAWDDTNNLVDSPLLRGWPAFAECFRHDAMWSARMNVAAIGTYRPISLASFVVDYQLFGGSAVSYHFTSIFWHALTAVVVFALLRRFLGALEATAVVCLWCVLPPNAEAVAWVNGRSEIFALLFGGLGVFWATGVERASWLRALGAAPLLLLGLLGKETGVIFCAVAVLLATEARHRAAAQPRLWLRSFDFASLAAGLMALAGYLYIRHLVFKGNPLPGAAEKLTNSEDLLRIASQAAAIVWKCFESIAVPVRISVGYLYLWAQSLTTADVALAWAALALVLIGLAVAWWRGHRLPVLLLAWWALSIAPVTILVGRDWPGLARWLYMGGPGLIGAAVLLIGRLPWRPAVMTLGLGYGAVWAVQAQRSIAVWRDSGSLFEAMIVEEPGERFGYLSLAWYYLRKQDYPASERNARKVLELGPRGHDPLPFLAAALAAQEKCDEARKTIYEPNPMPTRASWMMYAVGACFERAGRPAEALKFFDDCKATDKACESKASTLSSSLAVDSAAASPSAPGSGSDAPDSEDDALAPAEELE